MTTENELETYCRNLLETAENDSASQSFAISRVMQGRQENPLFDATSAGAFLGALN